MSCKHRVKIAASTQLQLSSHSDSQSTVQKPAEFFNHVEFKISSPTEHPLRESKVWVTESYLQGEGGLAEAKGSEIQGLQG